MTLPQQEDQQEVISFPRASELKQKAFNLKDYINKYGPQIERSLKSSKRAIAEHLSDEEERQLVTDFFEGLGYHVEPHESQMGSTGNLVITFK